MDLSLYYCFKKQAQLTPNNHCLTDKTGSITYQKALNEIDTIIANLDHYNISSQDVVAIYSEKSIKALLSFIALSAIGADVLTLDLAFPQAMLDFTLEDASCHFVLTDRTAAFDKQTVIQLSTLNSPSISPDIAKRPQEQMHWLVYSSGSTGKPKGIKISTNAMICSINSRHQLSKTVEDESVACTIYFYWEAFRPLFTGASLHIIEDRDLVQIEWYIEYLIQQRITETLWTPSFAEMIVKCDGLTKLKESRLKRVWLNGEVVSKALSLKLTETLETIAFYNLYSISETFDVSAERLCKETLINSEFASIGRPLPHVKIKVLDDNKNECAIMSKGELYIGGESLCEEYLNRPDLNEQSFLYLVNHGKLEKYFRTGDVAYRDKDNQLYVLGRHDSVVKLRGYNVSLLQIEEVLKDTLEIEQCVAKVASDANGAQAIEVFLLPNMKADFISKFEINPVNGSASKLVAYLSNFLPHYAIPKHYFVLDELNINAYSSKLERKNLKKRFFDSESEEALAELWHKTLALPLDELTGDFDFFELGGSSLQAIEFSHLFHKTFDVPFSLETLEKCSKMSEQLELLKGCESISESANTFLDIPELCLSNSAPIALGATLKAANTFLVTGATGFLGAHWLADALESHPEAHYYCLVRGLDQHEASLKLKNSFIKYGLDPALLGNSVTIIVGSLCKPNLGLSLDAWQQLSEKIDAIFHAAAEVNLLFGYDKLKPSIVDGTNEILKFACHHHLKHLLYISSDAVYTNQHQSFSENFIGSDKAKALDSGYGQAKWVAESLIQQAAIKTNLPFTIFRLGNLAPHSKKAKVNKHDANATLMRVIYKLKKLPEDFSFEFTPIDKVVSKIRNITDSGESKTIYAISGFNLLKSDELQQLMGFKDSAIIKTKDFQALLEENNEQIAALFVKEQMFATRQYYLERVWPASLTEDSLLLSKTEIREALNSYLDLITQTKAASHVE